MNEKKQEQYIAKLETFIRDLEKENQSLERKLNRMRNEVDRLREPPLVGAIIVSKLPDKSWRFVVQSSSGLLYVVNASQTLDENVLTPGTYVALNQRTFAIVEKLEIEETQLWKSTKKLMMNYLIRDDANDSF